MMDWLKVAVIFVVCFAFVKLVDDETATAGAIALVAVGLFIHVTREHR